jgi:galactokinase
MFETHEGLSIYYEVSCVELDMIVNTLKIERSGYWLSINGWGFWRMHHQPNKGHEDRIKNNFRGFI